LRDQAIFRALPQAHVDSSQAAAQLQQSRIRDDRFKTTGTEERDVERIRHRHRYRAHVREDHGIGGAID
jgi:hypothetical protein